MISKTLTTILIIFGLFIAMSPEIQAEKVTMTDYDTEIIHKNDNGTYGVTNSADWGYIGFEDGTLADNTTYRTIIWYSNIGDYFTSVEDAAGAIDRVYFNWTTSNNLNFNNGGLYDIPGWNTPGVDDRLDSYDWDNFLSYADKYDGLSGIWGNLLITGVDPIGGRDQLPLEHGCFLIREYSTNRSGSDLALALREYPESTDSTLGDDTSFITFYPGDLEVYYAPRPTLTGPSNGEDFSVGDTVPLSWSSSDSDCSYINYRLQLSQSADFEIDESFEEHIINGKNYSFPVPSGDEGERWYWRVQARNYQVDDLSDHSGTLWYTRGGACSNFSDGYFDVMASIPLPSPVTNPSPSNGATEQSINTILSWSNGGGATSYDIYFGTDPTPDSGELKGNQTSLTGEFNFKVHQ